jgi:hypothetical protein
MAQCGGAIAQNPECNQTDSTVSCCLKMHPGDYVTEGHTRCQDCYGECEKTGVWPDAVNEHPCPKVSK